MAIKRIDYYGKFTPTGPDFSTAKRFQALAGLADQVGEAAVQLGQVALKERAQKAAKAGALAGAQVQRDEQGAIIAPELQEESTYYGQAFNESAINAYKSGITLDARKRFDELAEEFKDDPKVYKTEADAYKSGVIKSLPMELQIELAPTLDEDIYFREKAVRKNFTENQFKQNLATVEEEISGLENEILYAARNGDTEKQQALEKRLYDRLGEVSEFIDPEQARSRIDALSKNVAEEIYLGEIDEIANNEYLPISERLARTENLLSELRNTEFLTDLTPDEKRALESQIDVKVNDLRIQLGKEQSTLTTAEALQVSNLEIAAKNGGIMLDTDIVRETDKLFMAGKISGDERTSIINNVLSRQGKDLDKNNRIMDVSSRIKGDDTVVVTQQGIDDYYNDVLEPQLVDATPEQKSMSEAMYIQATRMVPKKVQAKVNSYLTSGNPELVTQAAMLIDRVDEIPGMFDALTTPTNKAMAQNMVRLMEVMSPEEAYKRSVQLVDPRDQARIDSRRAQIKEEKYAEKYEKQTRKIVGDISPVFMSQATRQYETIFESYYLSGMDEDAAKDQAEKFLSANYSDSTFGPMMYAPEQYYAIEGDVEYIRDEIYGIVSQASDIYGDVDPDSIRLLVDDRTARTASIGKPEYRVMFVDESGVIQTINQYFVPDVESAKQAKMAENEARMLEERALTPAQQKLEESRINRIIEEETGVRPERVKAKVRPASEIYAGTDIGGTLSELAGKGVEAAKGGAKAIGKGIELATTPQKAALGVVEAVTSQVTGAVSKKAEQQRKRIQQQEELRAKEEQRVREAARKGEQ